MTVIFSWLSVILLAEAAQYALAPALRPSLRKRSLALWTLQLSLLTALFLACLLITARPLLAALLSIALLATIWVINKAKYHALREPLVFSDVYLYLQVLSHPRLFLPFLPIPLTLAALATGFSLLGASLYFEPALSYPALAFYSLGLLVLLGCMGLIYYLARSLSLSFEPLKDTQALGLWNTLLVHAVQAVQSKQKHYLQQLVTQASPYQSSDLAIADEDKIPSISPSAKGSAFQEKQESIGGSPPLKKEEQGGFPDLIVVQSESFFDARRLNAPIRPSVLQHFTQAQQQAHLYGQLQVPAWGANTLRPEYAFLSGLANERLQHYRYNPYQFLQAWPSATLASYLQQLGYYCICIHPNDAAFFKRATVFPLFGFDEFIDIQSFADAPRQGAYVSDAAVQDKIAAVLQQRQRHSPQQPNFIFVITMENHGPLHLESWQDNELATYYTQAPFTQHHDLTVYLRHLQNADHMLHTLMQSLSQQERAALLCWYGDHVPSMPQVYQALDFKGGHTDYLLWHNKKTAQQAHEQILAIEALGLKLLQLADL